ncbi:MAG: hypothetical protein HKN20_16620 [Gemmatimonadetes bacterium]|nr:hypothetical protein [Gemmatimonadota bacterium]
MHTRLHQSVAILTTVAALFAPLSSFAQSSLPESAASNRGAFGAADFTEPPILRGAIDPAEYFVGPGDGLSVTIWGSSVLRFSEMVTPEGEIVLPGIATVPVSGMSLTDAKGAISSAVQRTYRNVRITTSLVRIRQIRVNVLGEVTNPGTYVAHAMDLTSELIRKAGGLTEGASNRNIVISRKSGGTSRVDLPRYLNLGDLEKNPPILDGDVIIVPSAKSYVFIYGAIPRPGTYEHVDGETIESLIELAGGFSRGAIEDTVEIRVFLDSITTETRFVDISSTGRGDLALNDGDQVFVRSKPDWKEVSRVTVDGEAVFAGSYGINEDRDRVLDVIQRAGGVTEHASLVDAKLIRTAGVDDIDLEYERLKNVPVEEMSDSEYDYFRTKSRERAGIVVVDFTALLDGDSTENILLKAGDRISIPKRRETVAVSGQAANPGRLLYVPGKNYKFYVERAGGYAHDARKGKTRVIRGATGEWVPAGDAGPLVPGDVVYIPEKPERDWWRTVQDVTRFAASIATVYLVIDQATSK